MKKNTQNPNTSISQTSILLNRKFKIILSFVVVGIVIFYFGFVLLSNYTVKYLSVEETLNIESINNEVLGVSGKLVENSYHKDADGLTAYFSIVDEGDTRELRVEYKGEIGQVFFNKHSEIILQGHKKEDGIFIASNITVKCPSKYITEQENAEKEQISPPYQKDNLKNKI